MTKRLNPNHSDTSIETLIPEYDRFLVQIFLTFRMRISKKLVNHFFLPFNEADENMYRYLDK